MAKKKTIKTLKPFIKPFFIVFVIYCVAMLSIWRSGVSYVDDLERAILGNAWDYEFNRYASSWLARLLQTNYILTDMSPWFQVVGMSFMAMVSVIVTYLFCDRKIKYLPLIFSTFIGLAPFMVSLWIYKFDAPVMAFSILVSVVPFLFWHKIKPKMKRKQWLPFALASFACLMLMLTSYQASSGIYLVMILGLALRDYLNGNKIKSILQTAWFYAGTFLVTGVFFKIIMPESEGYFDPQTHQLSNLFPGILENLAILEHNLTKNLNTEWKILLLIFTACFFVGIIIHSKRKKAWRLFDGLVSLAIMLLCIPASYGLYLVLNHNVESIISIPIRSITGFGLILAIMAILLAKNAKKLTTKALAIPGLVLLYSFFVFFFAFGNALADQDRYATYRTESLLKDLSQLQLKKETDQELVMKFSGTIGLSPVAWHTYQRYPIVWNIIGEDQRGIGQAVWGSYRLFNYYDYNLVQYTHFEYGWYTKKGWKTLLDTYHHTISVDSSGYRVRVDIKCSGKVNDRPYQNSRDYCNQKVL